MNFRKRLRSRKNSMSVTAFSEKWVQARKFSRRDQYNLDESEDEDPQYKEIKDWVEEFFRRKSTSSESGNNDMEVKLTKKQTLILSTLVPDEVLLMERFDTTENKRFVGVLLMADVSGYTALSERYNNTGKGGTYRLTVTLNTYLGSLIELIYSHGGDILKFAGDAFLALWKTDKRTFLCHTIHTVIACALIIQHSYAIYETDVKVNLKVKLAISAGNLIFAPIGSGIDMNYIIFGLPVLEAKKAESMCASGEVTLTPTAWGHCYSRNYDHVIHEDGHVTIKSILYDPRDKDVSKPFTGFGMLMTQYKRFAIENFPSFLWESPDNLDSTEFARRNEILSLRKSILHAEENNVGSEIRKFMIRPVLTQIDAHQPLEYLTEMRQVSVLFMTLKPKQCNFLQLITIVNNTYEITCEIVYKSMGCVNKIILFDKDVMILVIFGLRGFKHESEAQAALKCAYSVKKSVSALDGVYEVSIGVTTGQVYCGVVGHPLRKEFTVIGAIVNKAARLMCAFRNKITCDETTFVKSKMSSNGFTLQPKIELKGIGQPGNIYEYSEDIRVKELYDIPMTPPLLDRTDEMEYFSNWIDDSHLSYRDFDALLVVGDPRIGKSRMLGWMDRIAQRKHKTCFISLTSVHSATPFLALSQIMDQLLDLQESDVGFAKEEKIVQLIKAYSDDLCHLNKIIKVKFAYNEGMNYLSEEQRLEKTKVIFLKLITSLEEPRVVFLDDLQNLDASSWEYICLMFRYNKIFTVLSVTRGKFTTMQNWLYNAFVNPGIRKMVLGPLSSFWIAPLACQILDVKAVPNDLCNALRIKCNGMPGEIENFIIHLFSSGALELKKIKLSEMENYEEEDFQFSDPELLHPQAINIDDQITLNQHIEDDYSEEIGICVVTKKEELKANIDVQNIDALVMIQIDSLTPYQQLLLKIASVVGNVISRDLLESIMYDNDHLTTAKSIKGLFVMRMFSCANLKTSTHSSESYKLQCDCVYDYDPENCENLPKYAFCRVMKFRNKSTRQTCYELLPMNQKKEFHSRIVQHLENNEHKCVNCGGSSMIVQSIASFHLDKNVESLIEEGSYTCTSDDESDISSTNSSTSSQVIQEHTSARKSSSASHDLNNVTEQTPRTTSATLHNKESNSSFSIRKTSRSIMKAKTEDSNQNYRRSTKRVTMSNLHFKDIIDKDPDNLDLKIFDMLRPVLEASTPHDWRNIGAIDSEDDFIAEKSNKESFSIKIEKGVSQRNIFKCTCSELSIIICEQLIHHAQQAEMKSKAVQYMIKHAYLNLTVNHFEAVIPILKDAENICIDKTTTEHSFTAFEKRRFLGRIYSIRSAVYLMIGKSMGAKAEMEKATRIYNINLHKVSRFLRFANVVSLMKRKNKRFNDMLLKADSVFCLNIATLLYSSLGDDYVSRISAFRALDIIENIDCSVNDICDALSNAIQVELDRLAIESTSEIERLSCQLLKRLPRPIKFEELFAVGKLFISVFRARVARGNITATIRIAFRALTISRFLEANEVSIDIIPDLFYVLLCRRRINEAIDVLQLTLHLGQYQASHDCETWYYALCMDMILDAGFQLESPGEISRFAEYALGSGRSAGPSRRRLVVGLWAYWLRANFEKKAKRFEHEALSWINHDNDDTSLTTLLSALRLTDGMLESLASKIDDLKKVVDLMELRSIADRELTNLEKDARYMRSVYPRWIRLKANSQYLSGRQALANNTYNQGLEEARRINNRLEESLAKAALSDSKIWIQNARNGRFMQWQDGVEHTRNSWHTLLYKITTARQQ